MKSGVLVGTVAALLQLFPTGDVQGQLIAQNQPPTLAAMEGLFESQRGAPLAILGQPDLQKQRLDNPLVIPEMLSFLTYRRWTANVRGLDGFPRNQWPDQVLLLYYSYHVMVGLGTHFHRRDGCGRVVAVEEASVRVAVDAVGVDAFPRLCRLSPTRPAG